MQPRETDPCKPHNSLSNNTISDYHPEPPVVQPFSASEAIAFLDTIDLNAACDRLPIVHAPEAYYKLPECFQPVRMQSHRASGGISYSSAVIAPRQKSWSYEWKKASRKGKVFLPTGKTPENLHVFAVTGRFGISVVHTHSASMKIYAISPDLIRVNAVTACVDAVAEFLGVSWRYTDGWSVFHELHFRVHHGLTSEGMRVGVVLAEGDNYSFFGSNKLVERWIVFDVNDKHCYLMDLKVVLSPNRSSFTTPAHQIFDGKPKRSERRGTVCVVYPPLADLEFVGQYRTMSVFNDDDIVSIHDPKHMPFIKKKYAHEEYARMICVMNNEKSMKKGSYDDSFYKGPLSSISLSNNAIYDAVIEELIYMKPFVYVEFQEEWITITSYSMPLADFSKKFGGIIQPTLVKNRLEKDTLYRLRTIAKNNEIAAIDRSKSSKSKQSPSESPSSINFIERPSQSPNNDNAANASDYVPPAANVISDNKDVNSSSDNKPAEGPAVKAEVRRHVRSLSSGSVPKSAEVPISKPEPEKEKVNLARDNFILYDQRDLVHYYQNKPNFEIEGESWKDCKLPVLADRIPKQEGCAQICACVYCCPKPLRMRHPDSSLHYLGSRFTSVRDSIEMANPAELKRWKEEREKLSKLESVPLVVKPNRVATNYIFEKLFRLYFLLISLTSWEALSTILVVVVGCYFDTTFTLWEYMYKYMARLFLWTVVPMYFTAAGLITYELVYNWWYPPTPARPITPFCGPWTARDWHAYTNPPPLNLNVLAGCQTTFVFWYPVYKNYMGMRYRDDLIVKLTGRVNRVPVAPVERRPIALAYGDIIYDQQDATVTFSQYDVRRPVLPFFADLTRNHEMGPRFNLVQKYTRYYTWRMWWIIKFLVGIDCDVWRFENYIWKPARVHRDLTICASTFLNAMLGPQASLNISQEVRDLGLSRFIYRNTSVNYDLVDSVRASTQHNTLKTTNFAMASLAQNYTEHTEMAYNTDVVLPGLKARPFLL